jgi:simple sugar transport system permease protein
MTLVIATRGIDISVGATVAISGTVAAMLVGGTMVMNNGVPEYVANTPMWIALAVAMGAALLCGAWNGALVAGLGLQPIVATLILMVAGRGLAQLLTDGQIITVYYQPSSSSAAATCLACRSRCSSWPPCSSSLRC